MTISTVERVLWRAREMYPGRHTLTNTELRKCIIIEAGISRRTLKKYRDTLITLGWLRSKGSAHVRITDLDLGE